MNDQSEVSADEVGTMAREITLGVSRANSSIEMTPAHIEAWERLQGQIAAIKRSGGIVEVPE